MIKARSRKEIEKWIEKKFIAISDKLKEELINAIEKGAFYDCQEPDCGYEWQAKPGEIFEKCPKCGSDKIGIGIKEKDKVKGLAFLFEEWP